MARGIFRVVWLIGLLWVFGMFMTCGTYLIHDIKMVYFGGGSELRVLLSNLPDLLFEIFKTVLWYVGIGIGPGLLLAKGANWAMRRLEY